MNYELNARELATVLAALRYWQEHGEGMEFLDIATNGGKFAELDTPEIDTLCERLNCA